MQWIASAMFPLVGRDAVFHEDRFSQWDPYGSTVQIANRHPGSQSGVRHCAAANHTHRQFFGVPLALRLLSAAAVTYRASRSADMS